MKKKVIAVQLNEDIHREFRIKCVRNEKLMTQVIREFINKYINKEPSKLPTGSIDLSNIN